MFGAMPMVFEENRGQWDVPARFVGRGSGMLAGLEPHAIRLALFGKNEDGNDGVIGVRLNFANGSDTVPTAVDRLNSHRNYYHGNDPAKWMSDVMLVGSVCYPDLYPGVSLVIGSPQNGLEYDLHVASTQCLDAVRIECEGVRSICVAPSGELELSTEIGVLRQSLPKAWFVAKDGRERPADCRYRKVGPTSYGFSVADPEEGSSLVVDPGLVWSTFLGGLYDDSVFGMDFVSGFVTVVGSTNGGGFPVSTGAFQTSPGGLEDAFVTRFDPAASGSAQLMWSTYLGGNNGGIPAFAEHAQAVSLGASGNVALCGITGSPNFPTTTSAFQTAPRSTSAQHNAFVTKLSPAGAMLYSTLYGGNVGNVYPFAGLPSHANAVNLNTAGIITVAGGTTCTDLILVNPNESALTVGSNGSDGWVAQFNPALSGPASLIYATYVTGSWYEDVFAVDVKGPQIYLGGSTLSPDFNTTGTRVALQPAAISATGGSGALLDGFVRVLDPTKPAGPTQLIYSTYLGSYATDEVDGLVVDSKGAIHCCGYSLASGGTAGAGTSSTNFPTSTVNDPLNRFNGGEADFFQNANDRAFLVKLDYSNTVQQLRYGTLFDGGSLGTTALAIVRVADQQDIIVGSTNSSTLPVTSGAFKTTYGGSQDGFLARLDWANWSPLWPPGAELTYCTYLGDTALESATCIVIDGQNAYIGGVTSSSNFLTTTGAFQTGLAGARDGFAMELQLPLSTH